MTAEVAILNRNAVALAADSAVTLQLPEGPKIYETRKLFTLSKYEPVGIMIYGNADFMTVPWETIVKNYRAELGTKRFARVELYGNDFLDYVESNRRFFPAIAQKEASYRFARTWLRILKSHLKHVLEETLKTQPLTEKIVVKSFREIFRSDLGHIMRHKKLPRLLGIGTSSVLRRYTPVFREAINDELKNLKTALRAGEFERACSESILRDLYWNSESGIVVAGFGTNEFFPALRAYKLDSIVANKLRVQENVEKRTDILSSGETAAVIAFAQSEMVALFMNGIDDEFHGFVQGSIEQLLVEGYPLLFANLLPAGFPRRQREKVVAKIKKNGETAVQVILHALWRYSKQFHSQPIVDIVDHLPKEELADMAEALVNLTSFKRHVTHQAETVGGPIDVAVISRGDGFIWIKRKHYFRPDLNPHFNANYFQERVRK